MTEKELIDRVAPRYYTENGVKYYYLSDIQCADVYARIKTENPNMQNQFIFRRTAWNGNSQYRKLVPASLFAEAMVETKVAVAYPEAPVGGTKVVSDGVIKLYDKCGNLIKEIKLTGFGGVTPTKTKEVSQEKQPSVLDKYWNAYIRYFEKVNVTTVDVLRANPKFYAFKEPHEISFEAFERLYKFDPRIKNLPVDKTNKEVYLAAVLNIKMQQQLESVTKGLFLEYEQ